MSKRITSNKTKHLLVENEWKKLKTFDLSYFRGKTHFEEYGNPNHLFFKSMYKYLNNISDWKYKGLSNESIKTPSTSNNFLNPLLYYVSTKIRVKFNGGCLKQDKAKHNHGTIVNIYIVYEISKNYTISSYPTLENCSLGAVSLTKHIDIDRYKYSAYGTGFDRKGEFSFGSNGFGRNATIFGADMSISVHANNRRKNILVLGQNFVQGLDNTTIYAEKLYSINFNENNEKLQWVKQLFIC